ncbi:MAG TPA: glycosyltransferase family 87 protein [Solirubrobacteraceae bacterium]|nr:glycosyltransferase family 87 protein [Solirubrobacteraceae bacterium]
MHHHQPSGRRQSRRVLLPVLIVLVVLGLPAAASAATTSGSGVTGLPGPAATGKTAASVTTVTKTVTKTVAPSSAPVLVTSLTTPPAGYRLTARRVLEIAERDPRVKAELRKHPRAVAYEYTKGPPTWQVSWFSHTKPQRELLQVYVDDNTGAVTQAWTGFQVAWTMARGYPGAFGRRVNAWYIWVPLCLLFAAPFIPWHRKPSLWHLDILVLESFSISLAFFNNAKIGLSVPLVYPPLIYLLVRLLMIANGRGRPRRPLTTIAPTSWLAIGTVFLMAFRIGLNILNSNVIDVGYSGVIGADKLIHGTALYGHWPHDNMYGDTYGPVSYYLYVPFRLIFGWSGTWDSLPAAHGAAIFFDVLCLVGVYLLGRRLGGKALGVVLAYCWAAYPFTVYALNSNTNDSLVGAAVIFALLAIRSAPGRGVLAAIAGLTKFAPLALAPLFMRGTDERLRWRTVLIYGLSFAVTVVVLMLPVVLQHDLKAFWDDSIRYQSDRTTPFSVWGLWGGLHVEQNALQGAVIALALGAAFMPARRGLIEVAALAAAILIALQLTLNYWLYPYITWFLPAAFVALLASHPDRPERPPEVWTEEDPGRRPEPVPIQIAPS